MTGVPGRPGARLRVLSGGQTGADQAAWRAARSSGIATGGWMPLGFLTEEGSRPEFADRFAARERPAADPADRTVANVREADAALIFALDEPGPGTALTIRACREAGVPFRVLHPDRLPDPESIAAWIAARSIRTLNVAGERASVAPGIGPAVEGFLAAVFRRLTALAPPGEV